MYSDFRVWQQYYDRKWLIFTFYFTCSECECSYIGKGRQMQGNKVSSWHHLLNSHIFRIILQTKGSHIHCTKQNTEKKIYKMQTYSTQQSKNIMTLISRVARKFVEIFNYYPRFDILCPTNLRSSISWYQNKYPLAWSRMRSTLNFIFLFQNTDLKNTEFESEMCLV